MLIDRFGNHVAAALLILSALLLAVALGGCSSYVEDRGPAAVEAVQLPPTCAAELSAPLKMSGANSSARTGTLVYCDQSRWDDVLQVFFIAPGVAERYLRIDVNTKAVKAGWPVHISADGGDAAVWSDSCSAFEGTLVMNSDEPDWSVSVIATCADDGRPLIGTWSGHVAYGNGG